MKDAVTPRDECSSLKGEGPGEAGNCGCKFRAVLGPSGKDARCAWDTGSLSLLILSPPEGQGFASPLKCADMSLSCEQRELLLLLCQDRSTCEACAGNHI